jgi:hypothetical protein
MTKKEPQNCWEYWDCEVKEQCPAYETNSGKECWHVASNACPLINQKKKGIIKGKRAFDFCWQCPWFKKFNPNFDK